MKFVNGLKVCAEILLGGTILVMLSLSINEVSMGDLEAIQLLVSCALFVMYMWLGWIQPLEAGFGLAVLGIFVVTFFGSVMLDSFSWLVIGAPTLITGLLFLGAGWKFRRIR